MAQHASVFSVFAPPKARRRPARGRKRQRAGWAPQILRAVFPLALIALLGLYYGQDDTAVRESPGITGAVRVVDGDTLRLGQTKIRLSGIDAPEKKAMCTERNGGARIACGQRAGEELRALTGGGHVTCASEGQDRYGRTLAICHATIDGARIDIGQAMVRRGWALAYRRYSERYVADEDDARAAGRGIWATRFQTPEDDRRAARARR